MGFTLKALENLSQNLEFLSFYHKEIQQRQINLQYVLGNHKLNTE